MVGGGDPGRVAPALSRPGNVGPLEPRAGGGLSAARTSQRSSHQTDFSDRPGGDAPRRGDRGDDAQPPSGRSEWVGGGRDRPPPRFGVEDRQGHAVQADLDLEPSVADVLQRVAHQLAGRQGCGAAHRLGTPRHLRGHLPPDRRGAHRSGRKAPAPARGLTEVGDPVAPAQQIRTGGDHHRIDEHDDLDGRDGRRPPQPGVRSSCSGGEPGFTMTTRSPPRPSSRSMAAPSRVGEGPAGARDGRQVATAQDDAHGQGPSSLSAPAARRSVTLRSRRETCICEIPMCEAIWSWLISSK